MQCTQPYLLGPGPDRPHAAPLGLSPGSQGLYTQYAQPHSPPKPALLGPIGTGCAPLPIAHSPALLGPTSRGTWNFLVARA